MHRKYCNIMPNGDRHILKLPDNFRSIAIVRVLLVVLLFTCTLIFYLVFPASAAPDNTIIYFYSSETNINNFKSLKMEFDQYLFRFGSYQFQPFNDRETFEEQIKGKQNCLILLSSWHYANIYKEYAFKPLLVGSRKGKKYQKRVLVTSSRSGSIETVKAGRIASSSSVQHTISTLQQMFQDNNVVKSFRILTVPKDIDALMSLGFGMAKAALTTDSSLDKLQAMNPVLYKKITVLAESEESLLLVLAVPQGFAEQAQELVTIFQEMPENPDGRRKVRMLGLDDWQTLDSSDIARLEN